MLFSASWVQPCGLLFSGLPQRQHFSSMMTSITFTILEIKLSTRSSTEVRGGSIEMAFLKSALELSLKYRFPNSILFYFIWESGIKDISKKTQKWSDREDESHRHQRPFDNHV